MTDLAGKVVLVTGGSRGIGRGLVLAFAAAVATTAFSGASAASVAEARSWFEKQPGLAIPRGFAADLAQEEAPARLIFDVVAAFGGIDVLVCNAGISGEADPWTTSTGAWDRVMAVNLRSVFFCAREAAVSMRARGGGSIVNISSVAGQIGGAATGPAYVASKAGVIGLTRSLARHMAGANIRVNCVAPADIDTDMTASWSSELRGRLTAMTPLGRFGRVDEMSGVVLYLAGAGASFVTGQTINVNGGIYMG